MSETTTKVDDTPQTVQAQLREELARQKQEEKALKLYDQYTSALGDERNKRLFTGMLKAIQQEANEKGLVIGDGGNISIEDAFNQAFEAVSGHKYGEEPPVPDESVKPPLPPGKQQTATPAGVQTKVADDPMPEVGEMPLEDVSLYVDSRRAVRNQTKSLKSAQQLFNTVENTIADVIKKRNESNP